MASPQYQQLEVTILNATGLKHLNHFTGDGLYVICEVQHIEKHKATKCQTQIKNGTLDPEWNESHMLNEWAPGEGLAFTIYDKGLMGSKVEGKTELPSEYFQDQGFEGTLPVADLEHATLTVRVVPVGAPDQYQQQQYEQQHAEAPQYQQQLQDQQQYEQQYTGMPQSAPFEGGAQNAPGGAAEPYPNYHPSHDEYMAQLQASLPPNHRVLGARYSHTTVKPVMHTGQPQEVGVSVGPVQTIHSAGVVQPGTVVHPGSVVQPFGVPIMTHAFPPTVPVMSYGHAPPMVSYGQAPPTMIAGQAPPM